MLIKKTWEECNQDVLEGMAAGATDDDEDGYVNISIGKNLFQMFVKMDHSNQS